jgi:hypothetical protein
MSVVRMPEELYERVRIRWLVANPAEVHVGEIVPAGTLRADPKAGDDPLFEATLQPQGWRFEPHGEGMAAYGVRAGEEPWTYIACYGSPVFAPVFSGKKRSNADRILATHAKRRFHNRFWLLGSSAL